jgi:DNA-directed RNA polymerase specialized sigma24 family protein
VPQAPADHYRALAELGIGEATLDSLATLDPRERAAIVASVVERFDRRDVATIVGRDGAALDRLLVRARRRFMRAHAARSHDTPPPGGPYVDRLAAVASHALR